MSWLFSQALVEEYLGDISSDGEQSAPLSGNPTHLAYCAPDKMTDFSRLSRFGMTYKPLTADRGEELLMSYLAGFHAKTSPQPEKAQELMESEAECGEKWRGSFAKYDLDSCSWKTHQCSLLGDLDEFSETWPRWGLMRNGECWEQQMLELHINETEFGLLPTPTASMMPCEGTVRIMRKQWLEGNYTLEEASAIAGRDIRKSQGKVEAWPTPRTKGMCGGTGSWELLKKNTTIEEARQMGAGNGGKLNPMWVEWLMNWPIGWTSLERLDKNEFEYWKAASTKTFTGSHVRTMWFNREAGAPSQRSQPNEQSNREFNGIVFTMSPQTTFENKTCEMCYLQNNISTKKIKTECVMWEYCLQQNSRKIISRVEMETKARIDRLKAIGNGQVSEVARRAWEILSAER